MQSRYVDRLNFISALLLLMNSFKGSLNGNFRVLRFLFFIFLFLYCQLVLYTFLNVMEFGVFICRS